MELINNVTVENAVLDFIKYMPTPKNDQGERQQQWLVTSKATKASGLGTGRVVYNWSNKVYKKGASLNYTHASMYLGKEYTNKHGVCRSWQLAEVGELVK